MNVKTVAFYNWRYPYGGGEVVTHHLARFFRSRGLRVVLYTAELIENQLTEEDRELFILRPLPTPGGQMQPENIRFFATSLREEQVDVLIVQGVTGMPFEALRKEAKIIFCLHNKPLWEIDYLRKLSRHEINHPTPLRQLEFLFLRKPANCLTNKIKRRTTRDYASILSRVDRMVMLCPEYRRDMEQAIRSSGWPGSDAPSQAYDAILNPMLPVDATPTPKEKVVLYVGRLVKTHKRVDRLLQIWKKIERTNPDWRLIIVGTGEEEQQLKALAEESGLQHVEFAGYQNDVAPYYRRATFCCLTSNFEGLPMCLMEGQQYGVIPVSFDSYAGIREITEEGQCGLAIPSFSLRKYASRLSAAMSDTELQERMRTRCYEAAKRYDPNTIGEQWLHLFENL